MKKAERFERILAHFRREMPEVNTELEFGSVFQLLVAEQLWRHLIDTFVCTLGTQHYSH